MHLGLGNSQKAKRFRKFVTRSSIKFDGTDDFIVSEANQTLATQTFSFWLKNSDTSERQTIFTHGLHYRGAFHINWDLSEDHGPIIYFDSGSYKIFSDAACPQQDDGNWHHYLVAVDSAAVENSRLWIDSVEITSVVSTNTGAGGAFNSGIRFGKSADQTWYYGGAIDEFAIFTGLQTDKDFIRELYNNGQPTKIRTNPNLAHWFRMGEGKLGPKSDGDSNILFQGLPTTFGSELVTNGDFSSASGWTADSNAAITGGKLVLTGSSGLSYQTIDLEDGHAYEVTFTIENFTSGTVKAYLNGTNGTVRSANGTYTEVIIAGSSNTLVGINPSGTMDIDNFSVKKLTNVGRISGAAVKDESTAESVPKQCKNLPSAGSAKSMDFDGTDDFALIPYELPGTTFTVSQWIKVKEDSSTNASVYVWDARDASNTNGNIFLPAKTAETTYKLRWYNAGAYRIDNSTTYPIGLWQHVVLVKDGTTGTIYVDGEKLETATGFSSPDNGAEINLGRRYAATFAYGEMDVDEFAIWDTVLDGDAIRALYNAGLPTPVTTKTGAYDIYRDNLKAYYKMGDATNPAADGTSNLLFDQTSPGVGAEQITNGSFSTDSNWTKGTGWTISGGVASIDGSQSGGVFLYQNAGLVNNKYYKVTFDVVSRSAGQVRVQVGGSSPGTYRSSTGTFTEYVKAFNTVVFYVQADSSFNGSIDNVSVKEVNGHTGTITGATIQTEAPKAIYALPPVANTKSLNFDGTNDHLVAQVDDTLATRYYSFWLKSSDTGHNPVFDHGASNVGHFTLNLAGNRPYIYLGNTAYRDFQENAKQDDGLWHHYVVLIDADITKARLFIDAEEQTVYSTTSSGTANAYTTGLRIGRGGSNYFEGSIDEFSIHEELDEEAIRALYNRGRPIDVSSGHGAYDLSDKALHWWRMGDATSPAADGTNDIIFQGLEFESDEMFPTNPSSSDWASLNNMTWDGTTLSYAGTGGEQATAQYTFTLPVGQTFRLTVDIENDGTGNFFGRIGDGSNSLSLTNVTTGTYEVVHTVTESGANNTLFFIVNSSFSGSISNISLNRIRGQYIGAEEITNGDFSSSSNWTLTGTAEITGGVANWPDATNSTIYQNANINLAGIHAYRLEYDVVTTNGSSGLRLDGGSSAFATTSIPSDTVGRKTVYIVSNGSQAYLMFNNSASFVGSIDNVSLKPVGGSAVMTNMTTSDIQTDTPY